MDRESSVRHKSMVFSKRIINAYKHLTEDNREVVISKQLLLAGTSIGINITQAEAGTSKRDFLSKIYHALRSCAETQYWLDLLLDDYFSRSEYDSISKDCTELIRMLTAIIKTTSHSLLDSTLSPDTVS
ncbi:MAG: four helix bundle protein [Oscillospiraceae bacterium]|jgi:four helix bundle protein|nr:four helix bundle protein [Oscillospiraceae bacterium]